MKDQLLETWRIHHSKNIALIQAISDDGMTKTLAPKGRTVFQQWIHLHQVRLQWLDVCANDLCKSTSKLDKDMAYDKNGLLNALAESEKAISQLVERSMTQEGKVKGFKKGILPLIGYFISHESHHRGNIMLTLKIGGEKLPDKVKWDLWEWSK